MRWTLIYWCIILVKSQSSEVWNTPRNAAQAEYLIITIKTFQKASCKPTACIHTAHLQALPWLVTPVAGSDVMLLMAAFMHETGFESVRGGFLPLQEMCEDKRPGLMWAAMSWLHYQEDEWGQRSPRRQHSLVFLEGTAKPDCPKILERGVEARNRSSLLSAICTMSRNTTTYFTPPVTCSCCLAAPPARTQSWFCFGGIPCPLYIFLTLEANLLLALISISFLTLISHSLRVLILTRTGAPLLNLCSCIRRALLRYAARKLFPLTSWKVESYRH